MPALIAGLSNHETGCRWLAGGFCLSCVFGLPGAPLDFGAGID
jgi:hypothetical protein